MARFLSRDSYDGCIYTPVTQNHYLYGNSNPVRYIDPSGKFGIITMIYADLDMMLIRGKNVSVKTKRAVETFRKAYKMLCSVANKQMSKLKELHHVIPVAWSGIPRSSSNFIGMKILTGIHRTFHTLLDSALRLKGYQGMTKATYKSLDTAQSYKDVFNILMDTAGYFDKVCEPKESMRSKIWEELYGRSK